MKSLKRRLDRLENGRDRNLIVVPQYYGMSENEAMRLRFGADGAPPGARLVILRNCPPPHGFPPEWNEWTDEDKDAAQGLSDSEIENLRRR